MEHNIVLTVDKNNKQQFTIDQIDFKVMVRKGNKDTWEDFTGLFLMKDGWYKERVIRHIKESFSTDQFRCYTFGLFKRYFNTNSNSLVFEHQHNIELLDEDLVTDEEDNEW